MSRVNASTLMKSCLSLNFSASAFLHLKALYNVSNWLNESLPKESDYVNVTGASINCYSKFVTLTSGKGLISDGPGDYGIYQKVNFFGTPVPLASLTYTAAATLAPGGTGSAASASATSPTGYIDFQVYVATGDPSLAGWAVGSKLNISVSTPNAGAGVPADPKSLLNRVAITITSWDGNKGKATVQLSSDVNFFSCNPCSEIATASLIIPGICMSDGGGCYRGVYNGTACGWFIQPPPGYIVKFSITSMDLLLGDKIYVETSKALNSTIGETQSIDPTWVSKYISATAKLANVTSLYYSDYGRPMLVVFSSSNATSSAPGFNASYEIVPRVRMMQEFGNATNLHYALAILEMQGANLSALMSLSAEDSYESLFSAGKGLLGPVSDAELCFTCSWNKITGKQQMPQIIENNLPVFSVRPPPEALGLDQSYDFQVPTVVDSSEIPPAISAMGYGPSHFIRTGYISRFPPGSFKAPATGQPLGPIPNWSSTGNTDPSVPLSGQPNRERIGWGLEIAVNGSAEEWHADSPWGWGWDDGYWQQGIGKQWRDGDGANDAVWPDWQVLIPNGRKIDRKRLQYDLEHATVPLFSFVDSARRVVLANELALSTPCGVPVNNTCNVACGSLVGTGLNLQQCMANAATTSCNAPVVDSCNNYCGILGTKDCWDHATAFSMLRVQSQGHASTASYSFTVGKKGKDRDDAMYLSYQDSSIEGVSINTLNILKSALAFNFSSGTSCDRSCLTGYVTNPENNQILALILDPNFFSFSNQSDLTLYPEIGARSWPSFSDFSLIACRGNAASETMNLQSVIFCMYDWDKSNSLNMDEFSNLVADLEARREALKHELWARMDQSKQNLMKIIHFNESQSYIDQIYGYGVEFASPDCEGTLECFQFNKSNTLRISTNSQFEGALLQIGSKTNVNVTVCPVNSTCTSNIPSSYVSIDGVIEETCPLKIMSNDSNSFVTSLCLDKPKSAGMLALPDTNGVLVTSGNVESVNALVGLRGNRLLF